MRTNPDPYKAFAVLRGQCAVMQANAGRPQRADFLKLQRGVVRIGLEQGIVLPRQILYVFRQIGEALPESTCGSMHLQVPQVSLGFLRHRFSDQEV
jgi:hypothetical protein